MSVGINTNTNSLNIQDNISSVKKKLDATFEKLAAGHRINSAKDDAAGLAITSGLESVQRGLDTAVRNANDGISLAQVAEGGLRSVNDNLQRVRELTVQAANGGLGDADRAAIQQEVDQLKQEIDRVIENTTFGDVDILQSTTSLAFQVGAEAGQTIEVNTQSLNESLAATGFGGVDVSTASGASDALGVVDDALSAVVDLSATFGAVQQRFGSAVAALSSSAENVASAKSRIEDADYAAESARRTKDAILLQAGTSLLTQANQNPALTAKLLG